MENLGTTLGTNLGVGIGEYSSCKDAIVSMGKLS